MNNKQEIVVRPNMNEKEIRTVNKKWLKAHFTHVHGLNRAPGPGPWAPVSHILISVAAFYSAVGRGVIGLSILVCTFCNYNFDRGITQ